MGERWRYDAVISYINLKIKKEYHRNSLIVISFVILFYFNFYATCDEVALLH